MAGDKLTPKQEAWALLVGSGTSYSAAYREAYDAEGMAQKTIWEEASRLACDPKVAARVMKLQEAAQERTLVTVESISKELNEARDMAAASNNSAAFTSAVMGKAKVNGLLVDRVDVKASFNVTIAGDDADL